MKTPLKASFALCVLAAAPLLGLSCKTKNDNNLQRPADNMNMNSSQTNPEENGAVASDITLLPKKNISVGDRVIAVEIADTDTARAQGLSDRQNLPDNTGMLFVFTNTTRRKPGFWMKDMFISIDMIWIHENTIVGITPNVPLPQKNANLPIYYPPSDITHVLEVPAGWSAKNNITIGDTITL